MSEKFKQLLEQLSNTIVQIEVKGLNAFPLANSIEIVRQMVQLMEEEKKKETV